MGVLGGGVWGGSSGGRGGSGGGGGGDGGGGRCGGRLGRGLCAWVYSSSPRVAGGEVVHGLELLAQGANAQGEQEWAQWVPLLYPFSALKGEERALAVKICGL